MLIIDFLHKNAFVLPFFLGAMACVLAGGFLKLCLILGTIYIVFKAMDWFGIFKRNKVA